MNRILPVLIGTVLAPRRRTERGLSQSTENAILLAAAVAIAGGIVALVGSYVAGKMAALGG